MDQSSSPQSMPPSAETPPAAPSPALAAPAAPGPPPVKKFLGMNPYKLLFAMEYIMQGLANPFQGITYQSFFKHFKSSYGIGEADTQRLFSQSYLAWSFKPIIGFLMDAYGKTKVTLAFLMLSGMAFYLLTPLVDVSAFVFFWAMFALSVLFACTDVAVDRATVLMGSEESKASGKSKAAAVGLNQAICWAAIYGTSIVSSSTGGLIADNVPIKFLLIGLALIPFLVFLVVTRLPKDRAVSVPVMKSVGNFWNGLNTGPILWIVLFYFLFHFQPSMGPLWTNYQIETIKFSQTQIGYIDGIGNAGCFIGVLLFAWLGIKWQDKYGLKNVFRVFIICSILLNLTSYAQIEPWFSRITGAIHSWTPGMELASVRWCFYAFFGFIVAILQVFIRMSTFSLVGAVIPLNAAGSLFAGFMSVANLAYSFSYSSGAWLYENGLNYGACRHIQSSLFGIAANPGDKMSFALLILIGGLSYILCFAAVHMLPDRKHTQTAADADEYMAGPERYNILGKGFLFWVNWVAVILGCLLLAGVYYWLRNAISSILLSFFIVTFCRKIFLDFLCWRRCSPVI
ncbi:MAG: hypothetical protein NTX50_03590 [Candidatus Sumerlaeota bacterium]|nr:hypothetical protein [Candidatus Sumerlaeota bacterium]